MNIFLLSTSYIEDTICGIFKNIKRLHMLKENHIHGIESIDVDYQVVLHNSLEEAMNCSDLIIVIKDEQNPVCFEDQIRKFQDNNKNCIVLRHNTEQSTDLFLRSNSNRALPTILLLEYGAYAQMEKVEFAINQQLTFHNIKINQHMSGLYDQLLNCNFLKPYIKFYSVPIDDAEIMVCSVKRLDLVTTIESSIYAEFFHSIRPDIVISCMEATNVNIKEYCNILKYRYDVKKSYIIQSKYYSCDDFYVKQINCDSFDESIGCLDMFLSDTTDYFSLVKTHLEEPQGIEIL